VLTLGGPRFRYAIVYPGGGAEFPGVCLMADRDYQFGTHTDCPDLVPQLTRLSNAAFAEYEGAMPVDEDFIAWYLQRPGCTPDLCTVALSDGELASNVLVCIQNLQLGGEVLPCGIIDTVATNPAHRKQGLARRLMLDAHERMRAAGAEAAVLYTNPDGHPYRFYQRLGYATRAFAAALMGPRPAPVDGMAAVPASTADATAIRTLADQHHQAYDGYAPLTDALWQWHRVDRPSSLPEQALVVRQPDGQLAGSAIFAQVDLLIDGEQVPASVVSDVTWTGEPERTVQALLAASPGERIMALCDVKSELHAALLGLSFTQAVREVAMVLPFSERAKVAMTTVPNPWYVMVESVVGV